MPRGMCMEGGTWGGLRLRSREWLQKGSSDLSFERQPRLHGSSEMDICTGTSTATSNVRRQRVGTLSCVEDETHRGKQGEQWWCPLPLGNKSGPRSLLVQAPKTTHHVACFVLHGELETNPVHTCAHENTLQGKDAPDGFSANSFSLERKHSMLQPWANASPECYGFCKSTRPLSMLASTLRSSVESVPSHLS